MAYLVDITDRCSCGRPATVELRNAVNASIGRYCKSCGNRALARAKREEELLYEQSKRFRRELGRKPEER